MKKIFIFALLISLIAAPAFAVGITVGVGGELTAGSETLTTLSNNVTASVVSSDDRFAAATIHTSGSKCFATSSTSTKIHSNAQTTLLALSASDTSQFSGWDVL